MYRARGQREQNPVGGAEVDLYHSRVLGGVPPYCSGDRNAAEERC